MRMEDRDPLLAAETLRHNRQFPGTEYTPEHTINHPGYALMPAFLGNIHRLINGGMGGNPVQIHDLIQA
ncbi:hypothetical protein D3C85_1831810 [compost metagenome]